MVDIDFRTLFDQLPASLLCKQLGTEEVYANPTCLAFLGDTKNDRGVLTNLKFYDAATREPLEDERHPFCRCATTGVHSLRVRVKTSDKILNCLIQGQLLELKGIRWVILHLRSVQDNDLTDLAPESSPLANHLAFSNLLSSISSQLINVNIDNLDNLIEKSLGAFGEFCSVDRCYLFQFSADKKRMDNTHEWVAEGVTPYKDNLQNMSVSDLPYFDKIIKQKHVFKVDDVKSLPEDAILEKQEFDRERIRSVLCVGVHINDDLYGFIGCDIVGNPYSWRDHDIRYMKLIGEILSNSLENVDNRASLLKVTKQLEQANQQLSILANSDGLTGIANRRQFDDSLRKTILRSTRKIKPISLLMVDVDHFKLFNDTFGHAAGDEALKKIATALDGCCKRTDDLAARYGGEEFAIILAETSEDEAKQVVSKIMQAISTLQIPFANSPTHRWLTISVGLASEICQPSLLPKDLVKKADNALYRAKESGRNRLAIL